MSNIEKRLKDLEDKVSYIFEQPEWKHGWAVYQLRKSADMRVTGKYTVKANYQEAEDNDPTI